MTFSCVFELVDKTSQLAAGVICATCHLFDHERWLAANTWCQIFILV